MQKGKKVRHLKTSVTINPNRMLLSVCSLTTDEIISEGAFLTLNLDKGPSIYYVSKGMGGSRKLPVLLTFSTVVMLILHLWWVAWRVGGSEKVQNCFIALNSWKPPTFPRKLLTAINFDNVATLSGKVVCYNFRNSLLFLHYGYFCNANFGNYAFYTLFFNNSNLCSNWQEDPTKEVKVYVF